MIEKPWGHEEVLLQGDNWQVKKLVVALGHRLSRQYHRQKVEVILPLNGEVSGGIQVGSLSVVAAEGIHRIGEGEYIELSVGSDEDIVRLEDDYGRAG